MRKLYVFLALMLPFSAITQERWTLEQCVQYAQENNLTLKSADYSIQEAEINMKAAQQARFPSLSASTSYNHSFGKNIDPTTNEFETQDIRSNNLSVNSGILVYGGGQINNFIKQGQLQMREADLRKAQFANDIALQVASAYLQVLFSEERLEQAQFQLNISQQSLARMTTLIQAGQNPISDRYELEAQVARDEQFIIAAENNVDIDLLNLKLLLQLDPTFDLQVVKPELEVRHEPNLDIVTFPSLYSTAISSQPQFQADEIALENAEIGVKLAQANYHPRVTFGGSVGTNYSNLGKQITDFQTVRVGNTVFINGEPVTIETEQVIPTIADNPYFSQLSENLGFGFGLNLSVPIYNNYQSKAAVERAKVTVLRTKNQNEINKQTLKSNVQLALADAKAAKEELEAAEKTLESLQISFDNIAKQLELDAATTYDLTDARNRLDSAQLGALIAKYDYIFKLKVVDYYMGKEITLD